MVQRYGRRENAISNRTSCGGSSSRAWTSDPNESIECRFEHAKTTYSFWWNRHDRISLIRGPSSFFLFRHGDQLDDRLTYSLMFSCKIPYITVQWHITRSSSWRELFLLSRLKEIMTLELDILSIWYNLSFFKFEHSVVARDSIPWNAGK